MGIGKPFSVRKKAPADLWPVAIQRIAVGKTWGMTGGLVILFVGLVCRLQPGSVPGWVVQRYFPKDRRQTHSMKVLD